MFGEGPMNQSSLAGSYHHQNPYAKYGLLLSIMCFSPQAFLASHLAIVQGILDLDTITRDYSSLPTDTFFNPTFDSTARDCAVNGIGLWNSLVDRLGFGHGSTICLTLYGRLVSLNTLSNLYELVKILKC